MREWYAAAELADLQLPGLPRTKQGIAAKAERAGWRERLGPTGLPQARERKGRGGGWEYHYSILASDQVWRLLKLHQAGDPRVLSPGEEPTAPKRKEAPAGAAEASDEFKRLSEKAQAEARRRLEVLDDVDRMEQTGIGRHCSVAMIADQRGIGRSTIWNWLKAVTEVDRADWLLALAPRRWGRPASAECSPEAWEYLKSDYLRLQKPSFESCYARVKRAAAKHGWTVPSSNTLRRRLEREVPFPTLVLARQGEEAHKRLYPAQKRDRTSLHALQAVVTDGHVWDVMVEWPDGARRRPVMVAISDLYSNKLLGWRIGESENKDLIRLAFGDVFRDWGIPDIAVMDNGRAFNSKWITGGQKARWRFKIKPEDPEGVLTVFGVKVVPTRPYSGRSKPIERSFRDLCDHVARHPAFEGAYLGNKAENRPEDATGAVPLERFLEVVSTELDAWNARPNRRTAVCGGTMSFDQAFARSYEQSPIRRAPEGQLYHFMLAAEQVTARKPTGELHFMGNRYWAECLHDWIGRKLTVRFDPAAMHQPLQVWRPDGRYLGEAECIETTGFFDHQAARDQARAIRQWRKAAKQQLEIERRLSGEQLADMLAGEEPKPIKPERNVVAAKFKKKPSEPPDEPAEIIDWDDLHARGIEKIRQQNEGA